MSYPSEHTAARATTLLSPAPLLVATDGTRDADGAIRVGRALAERDGVSVDLVSVVEMFTILDHEGGPLPDIEHLASLVRDARVTDLLAQRDRTHPGIHEWPVEIETGSRVETILSLARRKNASLIVIGLGEHGVAARLLRRETALHVIRDAQVPVLAVPRYAWGVPHSAIAAIDFTRSSERAAAAALDLLAGEGTLYIAHVLPRTAIPHAEPRLWPTPDDSVMPRLEAFVRELNPPPGVQIEYVLLHGDPAQELLAFAEERSVDMVAVGAHGRSALERLVLGSVSTKIVRTADRWVLVAPADGTAVPPPNDET